VTKVSEVSLGWRVMAGLALGVAAQMLAGCNGFFVYPGTAATAGSTTVGNVAYVSDSLSGVDYINGYTVSSGTLAAATGSPYNLGYEPLAMVVTPADTFLYVASSTGQIYAYTLGAGGALSIANSGSAVAAEEVAAMDVSPDGKYLFVLDASTPTAPYMEQYTINTTTGVLTQYNVIPFPGPTQTVAFGSLKVAPSGEFVAVSLGQDGDLVYPYTESTGTVNTTGTIIPSGSTSANPVGDSALAIDTSNNLYIARTGELVVYTVNSAGVPSSNAVLTPAVAGSAPYSLLSSSSGAYLYEGSSSLSQISGYASTSTASTLTLTSITGSPASPFTAPTNVGAMARDLSGDYVVAAGFNATSGVQLFKINSNGGLSSIASQGTLTASPSPVIIAMTH
jgi:6-phosphogluconolactonase